MSRVREYPMNEDTDELKIGYVPIQPRYSQYVRKVPLTCIHVKSTVDNDERSDGWLRK
jgi:hypothetical protein